MANFVEISNKIKAWTRYVPFDEKAKVQVLNLTSLPIVTHPVAVMPDVHFGKGATVGTVVPTKKAIIPAAVGVDIGCGMCAVKTNLTANDLPDNLRGLRLSIEKAIPVGFDRWNDDLPQTIIQQWHNQLFTRYQSIIAKHPHIGFNSKTNKYNLNSVHQLGTLGGGNHFIEVCLDVDENVWFMLHSGSRGIGNAIGNYFIELAKKDMGVLLGNLPDQDLAYLKEGTTHFDDYFFAVHWAQDYAKINRELMMENLINVVSNYLGRTIHKDFLAVNCHHNYVALEHHFGEELYITRKGAVSAKKGELGIIPGSMGAKSFIVRGLGNEDSYTSCSHGAGRIMSRNQAKKIINLEEHRRATSDVECRKDKHVLDESPKAYKNIEDVMKSQQDLVEVVAELKQIICVKG